MSVNHYENFPVASWLLPAPLRAPVAAIYHVARSADDIADEGDATPAQRLAQLASYQADLERIAQGQTPELPLFQRLVPHVHAHQLPLHAFHDLFDAFCQDVRVTRYACYADLLDYCRRSANPVGRLMLALFKVNTPQALAQSDAICTALQLINFWQDVAIDWQKNRVYLPQDDLARYGITEQDIAEGRAHGPWADMMDFQIERSRALMQQGAALVHQLPGRMGWEIRLVVQGGLAILRKLQARRGDVFRQRPTLQALDWLALAGRALVM